MKIRFVTLVLVAFCNLSIKAFDSSSSSYADHTPRFRAGLSVGLVVFDFWTSKSGMLIIPSSSSSDAKPMSYSVSMFRPLGCSLGYRIYKTLYFQTGGIFTQQHIKELSDQMPVPKGASRNTFMYTYTSKFFQVPLSLSLVTNNNISPYINIGVKSNFLFYESLSGYNITSRMYNPANSSVIVQTEPYDLTDNHFKFKSLVPFASLGMLVWAKQDRLGFVIYSSFDFAPIITKESTVPNFSFNELSTTNFQVVYNF